MQVQCSTVSRVSSCFRIVINVCICIVKKRARGGVRYSTVGGVRKGSVGTAKMAKILFLSFDHCLLLQAMVE